MIRGAVTTAILDYTVSAKIKAAPRVFCRFELFSSIALLTFPKRVPRPRFGGQVTVRELPPAAEIGRGGHYSNGEGGVVFMVFYCTAIARSANRKKGWRVFMSVRIPNRGNCRAKALGILPHTPNPALGLNIIFYSRAFWRARADPNHHPALSVENTRARGPPPLPLARGARPYFWHLLYFHIFSL